MHAWACCVSRGTVAWRRELLTVLRLFLSSPLAAPGCTLRPRHYGIACSAPMSVRPVMLFCCVFFVEITVLGRKGPVNNPPAVSR